MLARFFLENQVRLYSTKNVLESRGLPIKIPEISLLDFLWLKMKRFSNKTAIQCFENGRSYTYSQLYQKSLSFGNFLKNNPALHKNGSVGIILENSPEYPIVMLGAIQAGLKVTTCNPFSTSEELQRQLFNSDTSIVVTSPHFLSKTNEFKLPTIEISAANNSFNRNCISFEEISKSKCEPWDFVGSCHDTILLPYSSGTTGLPKGVELTHFNLMATLHNLSAPGFHLLFDADESQDVVPGFVPFFHIYGIVILLLNTLLHGGHIVSMPEFSSQKFLRLLRQYKPSVVYGPPSTILLTNNTDSIKSEDLETVRFFLSGGAPLTITDVEKFFAKTQNKVNLLQGYGMTETTAVASIQTKEISGGFLSGGTGLLVPNTKLRIISIDDEDAKKNLKANETGEVVIQGPQVMKGYYKNPTATNATFLEDAWMKTGDVGYFNEDGQIFVTDRLKELIKVKGFQVAPAEIEEILRQHSDIDDAAVVGVPHPYLGEAPKAFVVLKKDRKTTANDVHDFIAGKLSKHKHLVGGVIFLNAIPKNPSGKILRKDLKML